MHLPADSRSRVHLGRGVVEVLVLDSSSSSSCPSAAAARHARGSPFSLHVVDETSPCPPPPPSCAAPSVEDKSAAWNKVAEEAFLAVDGDGTGWESDDDGGGKVAGGERRRRRRSNAAADARDGDGDDSAESLAAAHPGEPIVERLEDIWQVAKLHRERKEREEQEMRKSGRGGENGGGNEEQNDDGGDDESDALGAAQAAAKAAEDASRAAVVAAAAKAKAQSVV